MSARKQRIIWCGDAVVPSGFATVTHNILDRLSTDRWKVGVLGVNHRGDPYPYSYPIWPAGLDGSVWGFNRIEKVLRFAQKDAPVDAIVMNADVWVVVGWVQKLIEGFEDKKNLPALVSYIPIDTMHVTRPPHAELLSLIDMAIFYTKFGLDDARRAGLKTNMAVIPHGVDLDLFYPRDRMESRKHLEITSIVKDKFVVGSVNRNSPRKRFDLVFQSFAEFRKSRPDSYLYVHCDPREMQGWCMETLARNFNLQGHVLYPENVTAWDMLDKKDVPFVYSAADVHLTTPLGEGWGLTNMESMACGVPQVVPEYAAFSEWMTAGAVKIPVRFYQALTGTESNGIGGVVDPKDVASELVTLYDNPKLRTELGADARALVSQTQFSWAHVAQQFDAAITSAIRLKNGETVGRPALRAVN